MPASFHCSTAACASAPIHGGSADSDSSKSMPLGWPASARIFFAAATSRFIKPMSE